MSGEGAVYGTILNSQLDRNLERFVLRTVGSAIDPELLRSSPERIRALPGPVLHGVVRAFSDAISTVFLWVIPVAVIGFVLVLFLREIPLRETAHMGTAEALEEAAGLAFEPGSTPARFPT